MLDENPKILIRDGSDWNDCLLDKPLDSNFDTIIINDRIVKHQVRFYFRERGTNEQPCHRDVIISLVRNPLSDGSDIKVVEENGTNGKPSCNKKGIQ